MNDAAVQTTFASATHRQFVAGMLARCRAAGAITASAWKEAHAERALSKLAKLVELIESGATRTCAFARSIELLAPGTSFATAAGTEAESATHQLHNARSLLKQRCEHLGVTHA